MEFSSRAKSQPTQHHTRPPIHVGWAITAMILVNIAATPTPAARADQIGRCSKAILSGHSRILATDARLLSRCTRNIVEERSAQATEDACSKLRTLDIGSDRVERSARARILRQCAIVQPAWLPDRCMGPGPQSERALSDVQAVTDCIASAGHCLALSAAESLLGENHQALAAQNAANLTYEFAGIAGNSFSACIDAVTTTSTTTSTTVPLATTTTTTTTIAAAVERLVITEVMSNPAAQSDSSGEYFELWNGGNAVVDLQGITVRDLGSNSFTIDASLVVSPGGFAVLGRSDTAADGTVAYAYGSAMALSNGGDAIVLERDGIILDQLVYDGSFALVPGRSIELAASAYNSSDNDLASSWCASDTAMGDGDFGTPGASRGGCLAP